MDATGTVSGVPQSEGVVSQCGQTQVNHVTLPQDPCVNTGTKLLAAKVPKLNLWTVNGVPTVQPVSQGQTVRAVQTPTSTSYGYGTATNSNNNQNHCQLH